MSGYFIHQFSSGCPWWSKCEHIPRVRGRPPHPVPSPRPEFELRLRPPSRFGSFMRMESALALLDFQPSSFNSAITLDTARIIVWAADL